MAEIPLCGILAVVVNRKVVAVFIARHQSGHVGKEVVFISDKFVGVADVNDTVCNKTASFGAIGNGFNCIRTYDQSFLLWSNEWLNLL